MFPKFKTKAEIPAQFLSFYHEVDGEWVADPAKLKEAGFEDAAELKGTLKKEREAREAAEKEAKRLKKEQEDKDKDAEITKKGVTEAELKKIRAEVRADLEKEFAPITVERDTLKKDNRSLRLDTAVKGLFGHKDVKVRGERHEALWKQIGDEFDLTDDGKPMVKDKPGTPVEKYLADNVKSRFPEWFEGSQATGGGAGGAGGTGTPPGGGGNGNKPGVEQVMANPGAALAAARAAGVKE